MTVSELRTLLDAWPDTVVLHVWRIGGYHPVRMIRRATVVEDDELHCLREWYQREDEPEGPPPDAQVIHVIR